MSSILEEITKRSAADSYHMAVQAEYADLKTSRSGKTDEDKEAWRRYGIGRVNELLEGWRTEEMSIVDIGTGPNDSMEGSEAAQEQLSGDYSTQHEKNARSQRVNDYGLLCERDKYKYDLRRAIAELQWTRKTTEFVDG